MVDPKNQFWSEIEFLSLCAIQEKFVVRAFPNSFHKTVVEALREKTPKNSNNRFYTELLIQTSLERNIYHWFDIKIEPLAAPSLIDFSQV